jgi:ATP-dependent DNA ligase
MKIEPMLLNEIRNLSEIPAGTNYLQVKEDGERCQVHIIKGIVKAMISRSGMPMLYRFPEIRDLKFPETVTAILDCEICVFDGDKSIFYGGINQRKSEPTKKILDELPATLVVFDLLYLNNELLLNKTYRERCEKLTHTFTDTNHFKIAEIYFDAKELWEMVVKKDFEGMVIKNPNSTYEPGKRTSAAIKLKNYKDAEVVVENVELNSKGSKIFGKTMIDGKEIEVECQIPSETVSIGVTKKIKYLGITKDNKLRMPTRW